MSRGEGAACKDIVAAVVERRACDASRQKARCSFSYSNELGAYWCHCPADAERRNVSMLLSMRVWPAITLARAERGTRRRTGMLQRCGQCLAWPLAARTDSHRLKSPECEAMVPQFFTVNLLCKPFACLCSSSSSSSSPRSSLVSKYAGYYYYYVSIYGYAAD